MIAYHNAYITRSEQALVEVGIGEVDYADPSQQARIHAIVKIVKDLRESYDPFWTPDMLAVDQRAIFAVCSIFTYSHVQQHSVWETAFVTACEEQGVHISGGGEATRNLSNAATAIQGGAISILLPW
jgi:hypothetical protein